MLYKEEIYKKYVSNHNVHLYGNTSIQAIERNFTLWDYFYERFLPKNKNSKILDLGSGEGAFVYYLQQKGYLDTYGIDISDEQIKLGETLGIEKIQKIDIISFLKKSENTYDFVIARDVLEHFTKPEIFEILKLTHNVLKQEGQMMIQVPNGWGIWHEKIYYGDITHESLFSIDSARQVFFSTGFAKVDSYPLEFPVVNIKSFIRKIVWRGMVFQSKFRKWIATGDGSGIFTPNLLVVGQK